MKLIIDISKEDYEIMKHNIAVDNPLCPLSEKEMVSIIANGTPVPKIADVLEPKTAGHWIEHSHEAGDNWEYSKYECSKCHTWTDEDTDYCPYCGRYMI